MAHTRTAHQTATGGPVPRSRTTPRFNTCETAFEHVRRLAEVWGKTTILQPVHYGDIPLPQHYQTGNMAWKSIACRKTRCLAPQAPTRNESPLEDSRDGPTETV